MTRSFWSVSLGALVVAVTACAAHGQIRMNLKLEEPNSFGQHLLSSVAVYRTSDDKPRVAAMGGRTVAIWDAFSGERLASRVDAEFSREQERRGLAVLQEGRFLAVTGSANRQAAVHVLDGSDLQTVRTLSEGWGMVVASPYGKWLATLGDDNTNLVLFDQESWEITRRLSVGERVTDAAFSPDGKTIAIGCLSGPNAVQLFDLETGARIGSSLGFIPSVRALAYSPDSRLLAVSEQKELHLWEMPDSAEGSFRRRTTIPLNDIVGRSAEGPVELCFSPDGTLLCGAQVRRTYDNLVLWDAATGDVVLHVQRGGTASAFDADGKTLAVAGASTDGVALWDIPSLFLTLPTTRVLRVRPPKKLDAPLNASNPWVRFSPDGAHFAWTDNSGSRVNVADITTTVLDQVANTGTPTRTVDIAPPPPDRSVVQMWPVRSEVREPLVYQATRQSPAAVERARDYSQLRFLPDGRTVGVNGSGTLIFWRSESGRPLAQAVNLERNPVNDWAVSPDGRRIAVLTTGGRLLLAATSTGEVLKQYRIPSKGGVEFLGDSERVAVGFALYNLATGERLQQVERTVSIQRSDDRGSEAVRLIPLPDGSGVVALRRGRPAVWDLATNLVRFPVPLYETQADCRDIALWPDGRLLATADPDNVVRIVELETGRLLANLRGHEQAVRSLSVSPDGMLLASASDDGTVRLWDTSSLVSDSGERASRDEQPLSAAPLSVQPTVRTYRLSNGAEVTIRFRRPADEAEFQEAVELLKDEVRSPQ